MKGFPLFVLFLGTEHEERVIDVVVVDGVPERGGNTVIEEDPARWADHYGSVIDFKRERKVL